MGNVTMKAKIEWPAFVDPLAAICFEAQAEKEIPAGVMALGMIAAG